MSSPDALNTAGLDLTLADTQAIDDCWNRIGIHGDKSCPLLPEHIHCRNCSVYSAAATRLLDRYALQQDDQRPQAAAEVESDVVTRSLLMFRLGEEWLGIATRCLVEVAPLQPIHSLPHQRSRRTARCGQCARRAGGVFIAGRVAGAGPRQPWRDGRACDAAHVDYCRAGRPGGGAGG
ncbi:CheW-like domain protein [Pseudomonas fluorescens]|uniref:CheW-like domain protein n=1 Tax=Pseudomonas fluorescens TaxID=294 RepID=A0A8B4I4R2_PSEFL|nr:CheW-like domain protein [Pseudomonas fluorescens]